MLNKDGQRELAYVVIIDDIVPIEGKDRVECAMVGGWTIMVRKGQFSPGYPAIYFEIDSKVPESEPFKFLAEKHYKIKTQKYGNFYSQGLLMPYQDFGWELFEEGAENTRYGLKDEEGTIHYADDESRFLTKRLNVVYSVKEDNKRKANSPDKYKIMMQRHRKMFKQPWAQWMMRYTWGKRIMFAIFGKRKDTREGWPSHICAKTDVERIQNMPFLLNSKNAFVASEKIDGSSATFAAEKTRFGKIRHYVCSRNVVFKTPDQECYYNTNIYQEMYKKYNIKTILDAMLRDLKVNNIAIQAEVYGDDVQKRNYSLKDGEHRIAVFHIVTNREKRPMDRVVTLCNAYGLPHVPIVDTEYYFPENIQKLQEYVEGAKSEIDGGMREGIVFYDKETGRTYTKFVSPKYLMKYH